MFGNIYEYTDGTATALLSYRGHGWLRHELGRPGALMEMAVYANEQYAQIAADTGTMSC